MSRLARVINKLFTRDRKPRRLPDRRDPADQTPWDVDRLRTEAHVDSTRFQR